MGANLISFLFVVTVLFINLPNLDIASLGPACLEPLQNVIRITQPLLRRYAGALRQFLQEDKGVTLICVWGMPMVLCKRHHLIGRGTATILLLRISREKCLSPSPLLSGGLLMLVFSPLFLLLFFASCSYWSFYYHLKLPVYSHYARIICFPFLLVSFFVY